MYSVCQFTRTSPRETTATTSRSSSNNNNNKNRSHNLGGTAVPPSRRVDDGDDHDGKPPTKSSSELRSKHAAPLPMRQNTSPPQKKHPIPLTPTTTSTTDYRDASSGRSKRNQHHASQLSVEHSTGLENSPFQNLIPASTTTNNSNTSISNPHECEESTVQSVESFGTASKGGGGTVVSIPQAITGIVYPQARVSGGGPVRRRVMPSSSLLTLQSIATAKTAKTTNPRQRGLFLERAESFCSFTSQRSFGTSTCDASLISHASTAAEFEFHSIITASSSSKHHHHHHHHKHATASSNGSVTQKTTTTRHHYHHHHLARSSSRRSVFTNNSSSNSVVARPPTPPNLLRNTTQSSAACASVRSLKDPVSTALLRQISQSSAFSGTTVHSQRIVELASSVPRGISSHKLIQPFFTHATHPDGNAIDEDNTQVQHDEDNVSELNCSVTNLSHFLSAADDGTHVSGTAVNLSYDESLLSCGGYPMDRPPEVSSGLLYPEEEIVFEVDSTTTAIRNPEQWAVSRTADTPGFVLASLSSAPEDQHTKLSTIALPESILTAAVETNTAMARSWRPKPGASFNSYRRNN